MGLPAGPRLTGPERVVLFGLYEAPLEPRERVASMVRDYLAQVVEEAETREFVDADQAGRIAHALLRAIEELPDDAPEEHRRLVQAAAAYFALTDDASDDSQPIGFDDDERVARAVLAFIGRGELLP